VYGIGNAGAGKPSGTFLKERGVSGRYSRSVEGPGCHNGASDEKRFTLRTRGPYKGGKEASWGGGVISAKEQEASGLMEATAGWGFHLESMKGADLLL